MVKQILFMICTERAQPPGFLLPLAYRLHVEEMWSQAPSDSFRRNYQGPASDTVSELTRSPSAQRHEIVQVFLDRPINDAVIDVDVLVNQNIAEPRPAAQPFGKSRLDFPVFLKYGKDIAVGLGSTKRAIGYPVVPQIDGRLHCQMQVALSEIVNGGRFRELGFRDAAEVFNPLQVQVERVEPP